MTVIRATVDDGSVRTGDVRISGKRPERPVFARSDLKGTALACQKAPMHRGAAVVLLRWLDFENAIARFPPPFPFELPTGRGARLRMLRL